MDINGPAFIGNDSAIAGLQETRDQMEIIHDQTFRAIALGMDAQGAAEKTITEQPNKGLELELTKDDWSKLITGAKTFASHHGSLKAFDEVIVR